MTSHPKAILFGAIGTLVETSEVQRDSFNAAFRAAGLDWTWSRSTYLEKLKTPGGRRRIADHAREKGVDIDVDAVYSAKVANFRAAAEAGFRLRPGVANVIAAAQAADIPLGLVTTTGADTVDLIFDGLAGRIDRGDFAFVGDRDLVSAPKPSPEIYHVALARMGVPADRAMAIEDTPESAEAVIAAGIAGIGFPGEAARDRRFPSGIEHVVDRLAPVLFDLDAGAT